MEGCIYITTCHQPHGGMHTHTYVNVPAIDHHILQLALHFAAYFPLSKQLPNWTQSRMRTLTHIHTRTCTNRKADILIRSSTIMHSYTQLHTDRQTLTHIFTDRHTRKYVPFLNIDAYTHAHGSTHTHKHVLFMDADAQTPTHKW